MSPEESTVRTAYTGAAASSYDQRRFTTPQGRAFAALESERLRENARDLPVPSTVLEVGCGTGRFLVELAEIGHDVTGIDPSADMAALTGDKLARFDTARVLVGEGADLPFEAESFDLVYAIRVLNQVESEAYARRVIHEMLRVTRPGGRVLVEFATRHRPITRTDCPRLAVSDLRSIAAQYPDVRVVDVHGLLFFSQTLLEHVPALALPAWVRLERRAARTLPGLSSRCYVTLVRDPFQS